MKRIFLFLLVFLLHTSSFAQCAHTFTCTAQGCVKVTDASCSIPLPLTQPINLDIEPIKSNPQGATFVSPSPNQNSTPKSPSLTSIGCAENGSCYGDISSVNGTPKTSHVDGYFRKDGTYVRGHYRSKGR
jgi:hypothetical protein